MPRNVTRFGAAVRPKHTKGEAFSVLQGWHGIGSICHPNAQREDPRVIYAQRDDQAVEESVATTRDPMRVQDAAPFRTTDMVSSLTASPVQMKLLDTALLQFRAAVMGRTEGDVHAIAARGTSGSAQQLPHLDRIQRAFGRHDVSDVRAVTGGTAAAATQELGARAYATGGTVVLGPQGQDLHTVAHEAAHVIQQRGGVSLAGGVGRDGDPYERHADAVADRVVAGQSAEALLDTMAPTAATTSTTGVQRQVVQFVTRATAALLQRCRRLVGTIQRLARADDDGIQHRYDSSGMDGVQTELEDIIALYEPEPEDPSPSHVERVEELAGRVHYVETGQFRDGRRNEASGPQREQNSDRTLSAAGREALQRMERVGLTWSMIGSLITLGNNTSYSPEEVIAGHAASTAVGMFNPNMNIDLLEEALNGCEVTAQAQIRQIADMHLIAHMGRGRPQLSRAERRFFEHIANRQTGAPRAGTAFHEPQVAPDGSIR